MDKRMGKQERDGVLKGHFRQGRMYRPPLLAYPATAPQDWMRDDLPDLLWPLVLVKTAGSTGAASFGDLQGAVLAIDGFREEASFDGRLASIEDIPEHLRPEVGAAVRSCASTGVVPPVLFDVIDLYEGVPGQWLFDAVRTESEPRAELDPEEALNVLSDSIVDAARDGHVGALVKSLPLRWMLLTGQIQLPQEMIDLLGDYPENPTTRAMADAFIRSSFLTLPPRDRDEGRPPVRAWAEAFWRQNSTMTHCLPEELFANTSEEVDPEEDTGSDGPGAGTADRDAGGEAEPAGDDIVAATAEAIAAADTLMNEFFAAALDPYLDVDLYNPARHEVLTGIVARSGRSTLALLHAPHQWSGDQSAHVVRSLVETYIVTKWMVARGGGVFEEFQRYGRGKAKLMHRHMKDFAADFPGEPPEMLQAAIDQNEAKRGGWASEFQEVNLDATFAAISVRQMAEECDELHLYRHMYQPESGVTHGEWWAIEDYAMQRCMNPLHRWHLIPSFEPEYPATAGLGACVVGFLSAVVEVARQGLGIPSKQVRPDDVAEGGLPVDDPEPRLL